MVIESLLSALAAEVLRIASDAAGIDTRLRGWLKQDPAKLAFEKDLARAYAAFARQYPEMTASLFDESFLLKEAASLLAQLVTRAGSPDPAAYVKRWIETTPLKRISRADRATAERAVTDFLGWLDAEMRTEPAFQALFDSRALDHIAESMDALLETLRGERDQALRQAGRYHSIVVKDSQNVVIGDHNLTTINNYFYRGDFDSLHDLYFPPDRIFERVRVDRFVGRERLEEQVCRFLESHACGVFTLVAEAGMGKTAFLAHLVNRHRFLHLFAEQFRGEALVPAALRSLGAQIVTRYQLEEYQDRDTLPQVAQYPDFLYQLLRKAAQKLAAGEKIVIVCDALDEAGVGANGNVFGLPETLPEQVYLVVSQRPVNVPLHVDSPRDGAEICPESRENEDDIERFLRATANRPAISRRLADSKQEQEQFIQVLKEKSEGVWIYLHYVIKEIEDGSPAALNLPALPQGLSEYYHRYWRGWSNGARGQGEEAWDQFYLPLLGILAAAQQAVPAERMAAWLDWPEKEKKKIDRLLARQWSPFITRHRDPTGADRYRIYHASLRDFLNGQGIVGCPDPEERDFLEELKEAADSAHGQISAFYRGQCAGEWTRLVEDDYARLHLAQHLAGARQAVDLDDLLLFHCDWAEARYKKEGHYSGYLSDLERLRQLPVEDLTLERQIRLALCASSVISLGSYIDAELLGQFVEAGVISLEAALASARQHPDPDDGSQKLVRILAVAETTRKIEIATEILLRLDRSSDSTRAEAINQIAPFLSPVQRQQALQTARVIEDDYDRAQALCVLALLFEPEERRPLLDEALQVARAIKDKSDRAGALRHLAPLLEPEERCSVLDEALQAARAIENIYDRVRALRSLAPLLDPQERRPVLDDALQAARGIQDAGDRARALTALASLLEPAERRPLLDEALQAARAIEDAEDRAGALTALAPLLDPQERRPVLDEALQAVRAIEVEQFRAEALSALAPLLDPQEHGPLLDEMLQAARGIKDAEDRAWALSALAALLEPEERCPLLYEALQAARVIEDDYVRAEALTALVPLLDPQERGPLLDEALYVARAIEYEHYRAEALCALAALLDPQERGPVLDEALQAARAIEVEQFRAEALRALAPLLDPQEHRPLLDEALRAAQAIAWDKGRIWALRELAPLLELQDRQPVLDEALQAARAIEDEKLRAGALTALAALLEPAQRRPVLDEALQAARATEDAEDRAGALTALAQLLEPKERWPVLEEALQASRATEDGRDRAGVLCDLAALLEPEQRRPVLDEALQTARAIKDEKLRAGVLCDLAPLLDPAEHRPLLDEALQAARAIENEKFRDEALCALASLLDPAERRTVLDEAWGASRSPITRVGILIQYLAISPPQNRDHTLRRLLDQLLASSGYRFPELLQQLEILDFGSFTALVQLALERPVTDHTLKIIRAIITTGKVKDNLAFIKQAGLFQPLLAAYSHDWRWILLELLGYLSETIFDLGGMALVQATAQAVIDTARWWP